MMKEKVENVWEAIEDTSEKAENMKLRSMLMTALRNYIDRSNMSQSQAAELFNITQPRVSDLIRGKINLFALDALVNMTVATGMQLELKILESSCSPDQTLKRQARNCSQFTSNRFAN